MPIFDDILPRKEVWPESALWPKVRAEALVLRFQERFPSIHYDIFWETRLMNAQAYIGSKGRCVRLYGGLGRHRRLGVEAIAFALAHETGHHLGGPPRHQFYSTISSEERADAWACETGLPQVFGERIARRYAERGIKQLAAVWDKYSRTLSRVTELYPCE